MKCPQYSLQTLLVLVVLVAAYFPCHRFYLTLYRSWLANNYGSFYVDVIRNSELQNGDTLQEVGRHFDKIQMVTDLEQATKKDIIEYLVRLKMDILEGDQFFHASLLNGAGMDLQFRDGHLVNHYKRATKHSHPLIRFGFPIYYVSFVTMLFFVHRLHLRRSVRPKDQKEE